MFKRQEIHINAGSETREYLTAGQKFRYLTLTIRCYVQEENAVEALEKLMEDVTERVVSQMLAKLEFVTDSNGKIAVHNDALRDYEKITQENIDIVSGVLNEYLQSYVLLGYNYDGNPITVVHAENQLQRDAVNIALIRHINNSSKSSGPYPSLGDPREK